MPTDRWRHSAAWRPPVWRGGGSVHHHLRVVGWCVLGRGEGAGGAAVAEGWVGLCFCTGSEPGASASRAGNTALGPLLPSVAGGLSAGPGVTGWPGCWHRRGFRLWDRSAQMGKGLGKAGCVAFLAVTSLDGPFHVVLWTPSEPRAFSPGSPWR